MLTIRVQRKFSLSFSLSLIAERIVVDSNHRSSHSTKRNGLLYRPRILVRPPLLRRRCFVRSSVFAPTLVSRDYFRLTMEGTTRLSTRRFPLYREPRSFPFPAFFSRVFFFPAFRRPNVYVVPFVFSSRVSLVRLSSSLSLSSSSSSSFSPFPLCSLGLQYRDRARLPPRSRRTAEGG